MPIFILIFCSFIGFFLMIFKIQFIYFFIFFIILFFYNNNNNNNNNNNYYYYYYYYYYLFIQMNDAKKMRRVETCYCRDGNKIKNNIIFMKKNKNQKYIITKQIIIRTIK